MTIEVEKHHEYHNNNSNRTTHFYILHKYKNITTWQVLSPFLASNTSYHKSHVEFLDYISIFLPPSTGDHKISIGHSFFRSWSYFRIVYGILYVCIFEFRLRVWMSCKMASSLVLHRVCYGHYTTGWSNIVKWKRQWSQRYELKLEQYFGYVVLWSLYVLQTDCIMVGHGVGEVKKDCELSTTPRTAHDCNG